MNKLTVKGQAHMSSRGSGQSKEAKRVGQYWIRKFSRGVLGMRLPM